jgi:hypothetical protein
MRPMTAAKIERMKARFLPAFADLGTVTQACRVAKVSRRTVYQWLARDEAFREPYSDALDKAVDEVEAEARRRAIKGRA